MDDLSKAAPFLKWAGGKQRLLKQYQPYLPPRAGIRRYYEPFIGSAALFFHTQPPNSCLADVNERLIEVYKVVQCHVEALIEALAGFRNEKEIYYQVRAQRPVQLSLIERAARLIYLNRTCYNGLYRENRKGQFNVPFGRYKNPTICNEKRLRAASRALREAELRAGDFEAVLSEAREGDFVYLDPPYVPLNETSSFTAYSQNGFDQDDQRRLANTMSRLTSRGCKVMLSNSYAPLVLELYADRSYHLIPIQARRNINSRSDRRGPIQELLITNYVP